MEIIMDKDQLEISHFKETDSFPNIIRNVASCTPFLGIRDGALTAECLVAQKADCHDIVNFYAETVDDAAALVSYVSDYYRQNGGSFLEMGCGNANLDYYAMLQRMGFRIVGVVPDHYAEGGGSLAGVQNAILNRDMIRFRLDLNEKTLTTIGYDASGRT